MIIVYTRSNPVNPDPRVEKEMHAALNNNHQTIALGWERRSEIGNKITNSYLHINNQEVPIIRFNINADFGQGLGNLKAMIKWQFNLMKWLIKNRKKYDFIHAYDFDTVLPALIMNLFFNKKYVYDICDFYIDAFGVPNKLKPIIKRIDFYAMSKAEAIILVNEIRDSQIEGSKPKKKIYIHNTPVDLIGNSFENKTQNSKPTIFYGGILAEGRMILETIEICKNNPDWNFIIAGFGHIEDKCKKASEKYENITFLGKVDYKKIIENTKKSDVVFACYDPDVPNNKYASPNKLYEAMMCGKPIIVCENTGVDKIVINENIGLVCRYDRTALENAFIKIIENKVLSMEMGKKSRELYLTKYNWAIMENELNGFYNKIETLINIK
ncbi:glycosyltransferase family 4 protein [Psychrobacillus sp. BM2]|uniref:glycosyltransferase family 4 protein n=1 Tax=Psychrobacillus sp. BM2 TaxID=3400421 RepID=UPI003B0177A7